jgi:hypothetical protein
MESLSRSGGLTDFREVSSMESLVDLCELLPLDREANAIREKEGCLSYSRGGHRGTTTEIAGTSAVRTALVLVLVAASTALVSTNRLITAGHLECF